MSWTSIPRDHAAEEVLKQELKLPSLVAAVLVSRGMTDPEEVATFLHPSLDALGNPELLPDFIAARDAILGARERKETIFVHGDYDVDGVTSAALFTRFLQTIGCNVIAHVPHRMKHGYGVHHEAIEHAQREGAKLFLTCDCGISAHEQVDMAKEAGMAVVVTDHHTVGDTLPAASAVVNPHRKDSEYPFKELCGAGVVFRLCEGLTTELGMKKEQYRRAFLDLTVLGTVADVMPLTGENRVIAAHGIRLLKETRKPGLRALIRESGVLERGDGQLRCWHIGFMLGPRLNAAGRIDDAARSLKLLLSTDDIESGLIAREIEGINKERKEQQERLITEAVEKVLEQGVDDKHAIIVANEDWHPGIIGLVASRLVETFRRPAIVISIDSAKGIGKASCRSIPGLNLAELLHAHTDLVSGGGHAMAAGFSVESSRIGEVQDRFEAYAAQKLTAEDFEMVIPVDVEVEASEVSFAAVQALSMLEPFGCANPEPLFAAQNVTFSQIIPTRNPDHPQLRLRAGQGPIIRANAFGQGARLAEMQPGFTASVIFKPSLDEWNGNKYLKWDVKHFEPVEA